MVKFYAREPGSLSVQRMIEGEAGRVVISAITGPEVISALCRKGRTGELDAHAVEDLATRFHEDYLARFIRARVTDPVIARAIDLIREHPLRANDAVQLATALTLPQPNTGTPFFPLVFVSADERLNEAARRSGLQVHPPQDQP